jgi:hypothetical protein
MTDSTLPPYGYKTWDEYAKLILRKLNWADNDEQKILEIKCVLMDCFNSTLDKKCFP